MKFKIFLLTLFLSLTLFASSIVIGIARASGAGKTTLPRKLQNSLGEDVTIICQDNYYKDLSHLSIDQRAQTNFDAPSSVDFELLKTHLKALKAGKAIDLPVYDFVTHSRTSETIKSENAFVLDFISGQLSHIITPSLTCLGNSDA